MGIFSRRNKKTIEKFADFPPIGGVMASKMVTEQHYPVLFVFREKRINPSDSGWRIFSGFESEEFSDDPENFGLYAPQTILEQDESLADLLLSGGIGSVYERKETDKPWQRVYDYPIEGDELQERQLTDRWSIVISGLFESRTEEDGSLMFTTGDKTLRMIVWSSEQDAREIYEGHKKDLSERDPSQPIEQVYDDLSDDGTLRFGYRIKERDSRREYDVIYGFSITDREFIMSAIYFDDPADEKWALETWRSIRLIG